MRAGLHWGCLWDDGKALCTQALAAIANSFRDSTCDLDLNVTECGYDNGECLKCSWNTSLDCPREAQGNGVCDKGCLSEECGYDNGDCPRLITPTTQHVLGGATQCPVLLEPGSSLGDGRCDTLFNTPQCACDHGDCADSTAGVGRVIFKCNDGSFIEAAAVCDGNHDCPVEPNGPETTSADELNCTQPKLCSGIYLHLHTRHFANEIRFQLCPDVGGLCSAIYGAPVPKPAFHPRRAGANEVQLVAPILLEVLADAEPSDQQVGGSKGLFQSNSDYYFDLNYLKAGSHTVRLMDTGNDTWHGAYLEVLDSSSNLLAGGALHFNNTLSHGENAYWGGNGAVRTLSFTTLQNDCANATGDQVAFTCPGPDGKVLDGALVCDGSVQSQIV